MIVKQIVLVVLWGLVLGIGGSPPPTLTSNYDTSEVSELALLSSPLEVPLALGRNGDSRPVIPINQKYNLHLHVPQQPNLSVQGMKEHMVHNDFAMLYQDEPPETVFQDRFNDDYHMLESKQFQIMLSNPSNVFNICLNEIFSDCQWIIKSLKRPLPFCLEPYTKYPLHFNLYVPSVKPRETLTSAIFVNATIKYQNHIVLNKIWLKQIKFNMLVNHLRMYGLELKNCRQEPSVISIKNHQKHQIQVSIDYKHKKYYMNNQPFDQKPIIGAGKTFRFIIQGRNATMTIMTSSSNTHEKTYSNLYLPIYCLEPAVIQNIFVGILSSSKMGFIYPLLLTSHVSTNIHVKSIDLTSSSKAVQLIKLPTHKLVVHGNDKAVQIASFIVRASRMPVYKNWINIIIHYAFSNGSHEGQLHRRINYYELQNFLQIGSNRFYDLQNIKRVEDCNETEMVKYFNYSIKNNFQIPLRLQKILLHPQFRMHLHRFTPNFLYPAREKQELMIQYVGSKKIPVSPARFAAAFELIGGMLIPFEIMVYDKTLICSYQGREDRCSKLKTINFGHHKSESKIQFQVVTIKNLNPIDIDLEFQPYSPPIQDLKLQVSVSRPYPNYPNAIDNQKGKIHIHLKSSHAINLTFEVEASKNVVGDMMLYIETPYQQISPRLKFHFQEGKIGFNPSVLLIPQSDAIYRNFLNLTSTFHENYSIKQIISNTQNLRFEYNEQQQFKRLQHVMIPFTFQPRKEDNLTSSCCGQEFVKTQYLFRSESIDTTYDVQLITSSQIQTKASIIVKPARYSLLNYTHDDFQINVLKANRGSNVCFTISNPYMTPMKYSVALLPDLIVEKSNDYFTYFRYAKRQKVDTYFCVRGHGRNLNYVSPTSLRQLFRLEDKPTQLIQKDGSFTDKSPLQRKNLSNNDYLNTFISTGLQICYKFTSSLYFKLLIQSEVINDILEQYPFEVTEKFIEKEYQYLMESNYANIYDQFYHGIKINLKKYCHSAVYPIFRFCQVIPLKNMVPPLGHEQRRHKRYSKALEARVVDERGRHQQCYMLSGATSSQIDFHMVIANNHSAYDSYKVHLDICEPKIQVGDIAFEQNHNIHPGKFIRHYFPDLSNILSNQEELIHNHEISSKWKIIPIYFTNEDYDQRNGSFKGSRFFQLVNSAPVDVQFTHYGFQNVQNVASYEGFTISQVGMQKGVFRLPANAKSTFKIDFELLENFHLNITNKVMHHKLTLYFYNGNNYYVQLHLVMKVAENVVGKIKTRLQEKTYRSNNPFAYVFLNLLSFSFICSVIFQLKKEEEEKYRKLQLVKEKLKKISLLVPKKQKEGLSEEKKRKNMFELPPSSIGAKIDEEIPQKFVLCHSVSQEELNFFKTLNVKEQSIISESSESQPQIRLSNEESERMKTEQQEKSQKSQSGSRSEEVKPEDQNSSYQSEEESEESEQSLAESFLPDGISVCNEQIDTEDFQFGFQNQSIQKMEKKQSNEEYKWFESHNPLKQENQPFPWMKVNEKKEKKEKRKSKLKLKKEE